MKNSGAVRVLKKIPEKHDQPKLNSIKPLPESYTNVPPMLLPDIAKRIQWTWPDEYGERQYVVMMGGGGGSPYRNGHASSNR